LGQQRTSRDHRESVASDPKRHSATDICRIAKGSFEVDSRPAILRLAYCVGHLGAAIWAVLEEKRSLRRPFRNIRV
jgi:hypothetical protein